MTEQWLRLIYLKGLSLNQKRTLVLHLGDPEAVLTSSRPRLIALLRELGCHGSKVGDQLQSSTAAMDLAIGRDLQTLSGLQAGFLPITDAGFPEALANIDQPPLGLFYLGNPALLNQYQLAVVGSRHASRSGSQSARDFAGALARNNIVITSGMALGVDSNAHRGALDASQPTIAVTATGIDRIYPYANRSLHREIIDHGVVVTEYPPGTAPRRPYFPQRNRIISGLSVGTLVVEAGLRSGSLITARLAAEQGREVFAIPGSIHSAGSRGCHFLIRQGAALVETPDDILDELELLTDNRYSGTVSSNRASVQLDREQQRVLAVLDFSPCPVDEIISLSGLTADQVSSILIRLELLGLVAESVGGYQTLPRN